MMAATEARHVRFRELLPDRMQKQLDDQGDVPMFSPSIQNLQSAGSRARPWSSATKGTTENKENQVPSGLSFSHSTPTPRRVKLQNIATTGLSPSSAASHETAFFTPVAAERRCVDLSDEEMERIGISGNGIGRDHDKPPVRWDSLQQTTPLSTGSHSWLNGLDVSTHANSHQSMSTMATTTAAASPRFHKELDSAFVSATADEQHRSLRRPSSLVTTIGSTPYKSMQRLDMLSSPYLKSCADIPILRRAIDILRSDPSHRFPHLLGIAMSRLVELGEDAFPANSRAATVPPVQERQPEGLILLPPRTPKSDGKAKKTHFGAARLDDSLTLSTDTGEELTSVQLLQQSLEKQPRFNHQRPVQLLSGQLPSNQKQQTAAILLQQRLQQTEDKLLLTAQEVEELQQLLQTTTLQHDKSTVELQGALATLQSRLEQQRRANEQSQSQAAAYRARVHAVTQQLDGQLVALQAQLDRSQGQAAAYRAREHQLTEQLAQQQRDHAAARSALEQKQEQLGEFLKSSQHNLDAVAGERSAMLKRMMQAVNPDDSFQDVQFEKLSKAERDQIVADFCAHLADSKSQLEELAAMVRETEKERRKILGAYKQVKAQYIETHNCMVGLEKENRVLAGENEALTQQVKEMHEYTNQLMTKQSGWDKRQQELSAVIHRLKEQIRTTETMIPIGLYKEALESANRQSEKAQEYSKRVAALMEQVASLSTRLIQEGKVLPPPIPPTSSSRPLQPKTPTTPAHRTPALAKLSLKTGTPTENTPPRSTNASPPKTHASASSRKAVSFAIDSNAPPSEPKSATRMSKIRALGGRKALEEQLRKARSPRNQQLQ